MTRKISSRMIINLITGFIIIAVVFIYAQISRKKINEYAKYSVEQNVHLITKDLKSLYYRSLADDTCLFCEQEIVPLMEKSFRGIKLNAMFCAEDGKIMAATIDLKGDEYIDDVLKHNGISDEYITFLHDRVRNKNENIFDFSGRYGLSIACVDFVGNTGWYVVGGLSSATYRDMFNQSLLYEIIMMGILLLIVVIYLSYVYLAENKVRKTLLAENKRLMLINTQDNESYHKIVHALLSDYKLVYYVDVLNNLSSCFQISGHIQEKYNIRQDGLVPFQETMSFYIDQTVKEEDRQKVHDFVDFNNLRKILYKKPIASIVYRLGEKDNERFLQLTAAKVGDDDDLTFVAIGFTDVDDLIRFNKS